MKRMINFEGFGIIGTAQTGTGKTADFAIPLVEALLRAQQSSALVLTPTRFQRKGHLVKGRGKRVQD